MSDIRSHKAYFTKVAIARQLLREKSEEIFNLYMRVIDEARVSGDYETAAKSLQWLMDHMPQELEDGGRLVDPSVDKKIEVTDKRPAGPSIQIGIAVGGLGPQRSLPDSEVHKPKELTPVIDIEVEDEGR